MNSIAIQVDEKFSFLWKFKKPPVFYPNPMRNEPGLDAVPSAPGDHAS